MDYTHQREDFREEEILGWKGILRGRGRTADVSKHMSFVSFCPAQAPPVSGMPQALPHPPSPSLGKALSDSCPEQPRKLWLIPEAPLLQHS